ncbi:MAG: DUF364 domain-containing protein [Spirochaetaceae bacterium]|nr:DUF364 domain-containing protein [Spirochaetaceae bacterium]
MINFDKRLFDLNCKEAKSCYIDTVNIGLGYTAVVLKDGRCGLCYTYVDSKTSCNVLKGDSTFEESCCYDILCKLENNENTVERTIIIAMINAMNVKEICNLEEDPGTLFKDLNLKYGDKVAMIGYFKPIVNQFKLKGVIVDSYDIGQGIGDEESFYNLTVPSSDALIISATSFINNTFSFIIDKIGHYNKPTSVLGPSTIMQEKLYEGTPVKCLGGTLPVDIDKILKAVRNGKGTPQLHKYSRKIYQVIK